MCNDDGDGGDGRKQTCTLVDDRVGNAMVSICHRFAV